MRAGLPFAAVAILLAGAASAQTPAPAPTADAASPSTPAATGKPKGAADTLSGVTVMPIPKKTCSSRDKDCIAMVVAELKQLYPEQLKQFCFQEQTKAVRNQFVNDQLLDALHGNGPPTPTAFPVSPVVKIACASDKK
jgi:hypothetical protein